MRRLRRNRAVRTLCSESAQTACCLGCRTLLPTDQRHEVSWVEERGTPNGPEAMGASEKSRSLVYQAPSKYDSTVGEVCDTATGPAAG